MCVCATQRVRPADGPQPAAAVHAADPVRVFRAVLRRRRRHAQLQPHLLPPCAVHLRRVFPHLDQCELPALFLPFVLLVCLSDLIWVRVDGGGGGGGSDIFLL